MQCLEIPAVPSDTATRTELQGALMGMEAAREELGRRMRAVQSRLSAAPTPTSPVPTVYKVDSEGNLIEDTNSTVLQGR